MHITSPHITVTEFPQVLATILKQLIFHWMGCSSFAIGLLLKLAAEKGLFRYFLFGFLETSK